MSFALDHESIPDGLLGVFERSRTPLTLVDPALDDQPLVTINEAFCRVTGYSPDQALGRNCRFLQPPGGAGPVRTRIKDFIADEQAREDRFIIANRTHDGDPFLNAVYLAKLRHPSGRQLILGSQFAVRTGREQAGAYEMALRDDLGSLSSVLSEEQWVMMGSMQAIANTATLLARHRLETD